jgi:hypothetical protein
MEPENHAGILESGRKVDTKWSNPRGYEGSGSRRKPPTTRQSLARRVVTEVTLESSAPIEERLTWPVRVVLLGGGGHAATSYQIIKAPESHFSCSFREKEQENDQGEFEFRSNH